MEKTSKSESAALVHTQTLESSASSRTPTNSAFSIPAIVGNMAMQRFLQGGLLRAKLAVGGADDPAEHEADQMAEAAMHGGTSCHCSADGPQCSDCQASAGVVRRKPRSTDVSSGANNLALGAARPLGEGERSFFESRYQADFSDVRLHVNAEAASSAAQINARAFSIGSDIAFGRDEFHTDTMSGQLLLAHELAHVLQQDGGASPPIIRRVGPEDPPFGYFPAEAEILEREAEREREEERRHRDWFSGTERQSGTDLANQTGGIAEERERIELALTSQRAAAFDAVARGEGWLDEALRAQGYAGPPLTEIKLLWAEALVATELLRLETSRGSVSSESQLAALQAVPAFYNALGGFARAAEQAHQSHVDAENARLRSEYEARLEQLAREARMADEFRGPRGEPGEGAARGGAAIARALLRPDPPTYLRPPPSISGEIEPANARVYAAETSGQWAAVATEVNRIGNGFATLVVASLPARSEIRSAIEYLAGLDTRLAGLARSNPLAVRLPAIFYPRDRTVSRTSEGGEERVVPEGIPWQFYLINTGVRSHDEPAHSGGEWILIDLTSPQRYENSVPSSDIESAMLQQGFAVAPPIELFSELNSRIRFPQGRLFIRLPNGNNHTIETTEPWSLSDWLAALGITLAAISLVAAVLATGGAAAPAAVAFYAGVGAAAAGIGSTLADLHERRQQGILTSADIDRAMISIAIDIVTVGAMGMGRLIALPRAAARLGFTGERFITLQRVTQVVRTGALAGDVYQAWSLTSGLLAAFRAIDSQPNLTDEERDQMRGQLVRRALLTGALLAVAIRGDIQDLQAGRTLRISDVDPDGALVPARPDTEAPHPTGDAPGVSSAARAAPHAEVTGPVHAGGERGGSTLVVGPQSHSIAAAGTGRNRDFYFCSDLCVPILSRLNAVAGVLPPGHPWRPAVRDMLTTARDARRRLRLGELTQEDADAVARRLSERIGRSSADSQHFAALMNTDPALLRAHRSRFRDHLASLLGEAPVGMASMAERQAASAAGHGRDPLSEPDAHSDIEIDLLGSFRIRERARPGGAPMPIRFDVGIFSHTHAEALVPGLPRGLNDEVRVTRPDGSIGRADRVRFIYDEAGNRIGAHVYEIKPNTDRHMAKGERQVEEYMSGLRAEIEDTLSRRGIPVPTAAPDGGPLYTKQVLTYNYEQMLAVLRALRGARRDAARMADYEAIARQVFAMPPNPG